MLCDAPEHRLAAARALFRGQPDPSGELSAVPKLPRIPHRADQRGGDHRSDAGNRGEQAAVFPLNKELMQLRLQLGEPADDRSWPRPRPVLWIIKAVTVAVCKP